MKQRGFTFIELILYIALVSLFITSAILFAWDLIYSGAKSTVQQEVVQNLRLAGKRITYEIRNASGINSITATSISLSNANASRNPTVIDLSSGDVRIGYGGSGPCAAATPCQLTSNMVNVTQLTFTDLSNEESINIGFSLTAEYQNPGDRQEYKKIQTYSTAVELRSN